MAAKLVIDIHRSIPVSKPVQPWPKHVKPKPKPVVRFRIAKPLMNTIQNRCCPFGAALVVIGVFAPNQRAEVTKARNQQIWGDHS